MKTQKNGRVCFAPVLGCNAKGKPIADAEEVPAECGVMVYSEGKLEVMRAAPKRPAVERPFSVWMALAKATSVKDLDGGAWDHPWRRN